MFVLVSSNSENQQKGIFSKTFEPLQIEKGCELETPGLSLDIDISHLKDIAEKKGKRIVVCQSTKHKKKLKSKIVILRQIKLFVFRERQGYDFIFTGHGYRNGDLCIETQQNPDGEELKIQEIINVMMEQVRFFLYRQVQIRIYIDSCFSGENVQRVKKHIDWHRNNRGWNGFSFCLKIFTSSGQNWESIVSSFGSLLIAKLWFQCFQGDVKLKQGLKKQFQFREPLHYLYDHRTRAYEGLNRYIVRQKKKMLLF